MPATDAHGNPAAVGPGLDIESAWGNAVIVRVVGTYPTVADRDQERPAPDVGECVYVESIPGLQVYDGLAWRTIRDETTFGHSHTAGDLPPLNYLPIGGGTMAGSIDMDDQWTLLNLPDPVGLEQAVPRGWAESTFWLRTESPWAGLYLPLAGGTVTGALSLTDDTSNPLRIDRPGQPQWQVGHWNNQPGLVFAEAGSLRLVLFNGGGASLSGSLTVGNALSVATQASIAGRIIGGEYIIGNRLYLAAPLSTTNNGLPGWRHNTSAAGLGWEFMRLSSDRRLKSDIRDHDGALDLDRITRLRLRSWKSEADADDGRRRFTGVVADEAAEVMPELVGWEDDDDGEAHATSFSYDGLIVPLVGAVQALAAENRQLRADLADLAGRVAALELFRDAEEEGA